MVPLTSTASACYMLATNLGVELVRTDVTLEEVVEWPFDGVEHVVQLSCPFVSLSAYQHASCQHRDAVGHRQDRLDGVRTYSYTAYPQTNANTFLQRFSELKRSA